MTWEYVFTRFHVKSCGFGVVRKFQSTFVLDALIAKGLVVSCNLHMDS